MPGAPVEGSGGDPRRRVRGAPVLDAVIPARDEALTVADNVRAAAGCRWVRRVIVVDDGSVDDTAERAAAAGAVVVRRTPPADTHGPVGSKAHAMAAGVAATDAEAILFVDADCTGLTPAHLDAICRPFIEGAADMSVGTFDWGAPLNPLVVRMPLTSGERVIPRWVFEAIDPELLDGYTIEMRINQVVAERGLRTAVQVMPGVFHRSKRDKFGPAEGWRRTWRMFVDLVRLPVTGGIRLRAWWAFRRGRRVLPPLVGTS